MVSYSFKKRFVDPIRVGLSSVSLSWDCAPKRQTVRAQGKRRHARPGEVMQLYVGMRTRQCELIGRARCVAVDSIVIWPDGMVITLNGKMLSARQVRIFAAADGFESVAAMRQFWLDEHGDEKFEGVRIRWAPL